SRPLGHARLQRAHPSRHRLGRPPGPLTTALASNYSPYTASERPDTISKRAAGEHVYPRPRGEDGRRPGEASFASCPPLRDHGCMPSLPSSLRRLTNRLLRFIDLGQVLVRLFLGYKV